MSGQDENHIDITSSDELRDWDSSTFHNNNSRLWALGQIQRKVKTTPQPNREHQPRIRADCGGQEAISAETKQMNTGLVLETRISKVETKDHLYDIEL